MANAKKKNPTLKSQSRVLVLKRKLLIRYFCGPNSKTRLLWGMGFFILLPRIFGWVWGFFARAFPREARFFV